jgi:hypothetical protein
MTTAQVQRLEQLIDETDIVDVVNTLADICDGKAEHITTNWQDPGTARAWTRAAQQLAVLAGRL